MTIQTVNIGSVAGDGTGDSLREGGEKINANFSELNSRVGDNEIDIASIQSRSYIQSVNTSDVTLSAVDTGEAISFTANTTASGITRSGSEFTVDVDGLYWVSIMPVIFAGASGSFYCWLQTNTGAGWVNASNSSVKAVLSNNDEINIPLLFSVPLLATNKIRIMCAVSSTSIILNSSAPAFAPVVPSISTTIIRV